MKTINLDEKIKSLPPEAKKEIYDFIKNTVKKYKNKSKSRTSDNKDYWLNLSEKSLEGIWNNEEDDVYNELLKR